MQKPSLVRQNSQETLFAHQKASPKRQTTPKRQTKHRLTEKTQSVTTQPFICSQPFIRSQTTRPQLLLLLLCLHGLNGCALYSIDNICNSASSTEVIYWASEPLQDGTNGNGTSGLLHRLQMPRGLLLWSVVGPCCGQHAVMYSRLRAFVNIPTHVLLYTNVCKHAQTSMYKQGMQAHTSTNPAHPSQTLYVLLPVLRSGNTHTFARPATSLWVLILTAATSGSTAASY